jgi:hypothetical protein
MLWAELWWKTSGENESPARSLLRKPKQVGLFGYGSGALPRHIYDPSVIALRSIMTMAKVFAF